MNIFNNNNNNNNNNKDNNNNDNNNNNNNKNLYSRGKGNIKALIRALKSTPTCIHTQKNK